MHAVQFNFNAFANGLVVNFFAFFALGLYKVHGWAPSDVETFSAVFTKNCSFRAQIALSHRTSFVAFTVCRIKFPTSFAGFHRARFRFYTFTRFWVPHEKSRAQSSLNTTFLYFNFVNFGFITIGVVTLKVDFVGFAVGCKSLKERN